MTALRVGNVVRHPDGESLWIVSEVREAKGLVSVIAFGAENASGGGPLEDWTDRRPCGICDGTGMIASEMQLCTACDGEGSRTVTVNGWNRAEVLGRHVEEFLMQSVQSALRLRP